MGILKEELKAYQLKRELPTEEELKEIFEDLENLEGEKEFKITAPRGEGVKPLETPPREGEVLELFPSIDGLDTLFLVLAVDEESDTVRVVPLSEFVLLGGPKDAKVTVQTPWGEEERIAQTDLWLDFPLSRFVKQSFEHRRWFKVGEVSKEEWKKTLKIHLGDEIANPLLTPEKKAFKESEAERIAVIYSEHVQTLEALENFTAALWELLKEQPAHSAATALETVFLTDDGNLLVKYDSEGETLILKPTKRELVGKRVKITFEIDGEKRVLYEGAMLEEFTLPLSKNRYDANFLKRGLKVEVL
jgi:hypothetical protein